MLIFVNLLVKKRIFLFYGAYCMHLCMYAVSFSHLCSSVSLRTVTFIGDSAFACKYPDLFVCLSGSVSIVGWFCRCRGIFMFSLLLMYVFICKLCMFESMNY